MIKELIHFILQQSSYVQIYLITFLYFLLLYFAVGPLFLLLCRFLEHKNIVHQIVPTDNPNKNRLFEIKHSLKSIIIFGLSGVVMVYLVRNKYITLLPDTMAHTLFGVLILTVWNEIHFFIVHRSMHIPFFYRNVHQIHHRSKIPTVFSVYSFHWVEAVLLSTVPLVIAPFINFSATAIFLYPLASILLNFAGHCNYRFGKGNGPEWANFGTRHSEHHFRNKGNYGFATNLFDNLTSFFKKT